LTLVGIFSIPISVDEVFGHGGGGDVAPPVSFQGKDVTVSTTFSPTEMGIEKIPTNVKNNSNLYNNHFSLVEFPYLSIRWNYQI